ncbi:MAG: sigma-70 family RNA polymerase sigma factor [bacterium]|nr:sigma-70 family RNA polymerase sigma factor [bacterium]
MSLSKHQTSFLNEIQPHQGMLRRIAAVYADSLEDRRDLLQEMLLQLWRSYPGYRGDAKFSTEHVPKFANG